MHTIINTCESVQPVDLSLRTKAQAHLDNLTKPQRSLGRLEEVAMRLYCIQNGTIPLNIDPVQMYTVAGDHGIVEEQIAFYPQAVTRQMVQNFLNNGAAINVMCRTADVHLKVVDAGCVGGSFAPHPSLLDRRIGDGTVNFAKAPAMKRSMCEKALSNGIALAADAVQNGYAAMAIGEMGIGNSTVASALFCAYLQLEPQDVAGQGAYPTPERVTHKARVIKNALNLHAKAISEGDAIDILAHVGGFEIATMAGIILGAAAAKKVLLVDGFIATAAYVAALHICPAVKDYCFLTHHSAERGYAVVLAALHRGARDHPYDDAPLLNLGLRVGEGTGAALAVPLLRTSAAIFNSMATFQEASVSGAPCA